MEASSEETSEDGATSGGAHGLVVPADRDGLPEHISPQKQRYGDGADFGASVWTGAVASGSSVRKSGGGGQVAEFHRAAVRQAVLSAAAMPHEAWQLEYSLEVHGLIEERNRMLKQIDTEQKKSKLFLARIERHACTQIIHVLAHMDRFAVSRIFNRWLFFHVSSPRKPGGGHWANRAAAGTPFADADFPWTQPPQALPFPSLDDSLNSRLAAESSPTGMRAAQGSRRKSLVGSCRGARGGGLAGSFGAPSSAGSSTPVLDASTKSFRRPAEGQVTRRSASVVMAANVEEIVGERGEEPYKEMLVRWSNHLNSRPSWVLEIELKKNASFAEVYKRYRSKGAVTLTAVK